MKKANNVIKFFCLPPNNEFKSEFTKKSYLLNTLFVRIYALNNIKNNNSIRC